jgi:glycosyltransferase involved in cell wall biosynthesis
MESGNKLIHCYIGGSGIYSSEMRRLIRKHNLSDNVKMIGHINRNEIVNWFNAADFYIMPSHHESFGITVIEALTSGVPVITTYNGASEFIIENENLGLLVNPKSPKKLAEAIEEAFQRKWDSKFITKFVTKYSEEAFCKNLTNYFWKIMK